MRPVHVWIEADGPKPRYAAEQLLSTMLGWPVRFVDSSESLRSAEGPGIAYSATGVSDALHIVPNGWLTSSSTVPMEPVTAMHEGIPLLFPSSSGDMPFDPFAAAFFCLTRSEEYALDLPRDKHGRPETSALHASRLGYLHRPVVDEWALMLAASWRELDNRVPLPQRTYRHIATVDLDNGFKYLGRPWWRACGSLARDVLNGRWEAAMERVRVTIGREPDPFVLDEEILGHFSDRAERTVFFVLASERGKWDHAVSVTNPRYKALLKRLANRFEVGLHPSYHTSSTTGMASMERALLESAIDRPVQLSRQHFLRMRIPETLNERFNMGMSEEHSMGLHDQIGFRAGTCTPYRWYDLARDRSTDLLIHPFAVMDSALARNMKVSPADASALVKPLIDATKRVHGTFTGLWHESFLARTGPEKEWRQAIVGLLDLARA